MLHFLLGRVGSGKTAYVRNALAERLCGGEKKLYLLVPEQFSYASERAMLSLVGPRLLQGLEIVSFSRLAELTLAEKMPSRLPQVSEGMRAVLMRLSLEALGTHTQIFKRYAKRPQLLDTLVSFAKEMKQCNVTVEALGETGGKLEKGVLQEKLSELALLMQMYETLLHARFSDDTNALTLLAKEIASDPSFQDATVFVDAFSGFTAQERDVLRALMPVCRDVYITLTLPKGGAGEKTPFGVFDNIEQEMKLLKKAANETGTPIAKPQYFSSEPGSKPQALLHLEQELFCAEKTPFSGVPACIELCAASNRAQESDFVARRIRMLLRDAGYRARDIAVIQRRKDTYDFYLRAAFRKYGVPFFEDRRQPVKTQPLMQLVDSLLCMGTEGITTELLLRCLKTGLFGLSSEEIAALESYAVLWGVERGQWREDFTANPAGLGVALQEAHKKELVRLNTLRRRAVGPVIKFCKAFSAGSGADKARLLLETLLSIDVPQSLRKLSEALLKAQQPELASQQDAVWTLLMDMFDALAAACGEEEIKPAQFYALFTILLEHVDLGHLPQGLDAVTIGTADRIRIDAPRAVFLVGANDGVFPETPPTEGVLSDRERRMLAEFGLELSDTAEYKAVDERDFAYDAVTLARENLIVSWSASDFQGDAMRPSALVRELTEIFPDISVSEEALCDAFSRVQSDDAAFEVLAELMQSSDDRAATLRAYFADNPAYADKLSALERIVMNTPAAFSDTDVSLRLFGRDMLVSASQAELFYKCPFSYFCRYGLKLRPLKKAELDPAQSGTIIHFCLEQILAQYDKAMLSDMSTAQLRKTVQTTIAAYAAERLGGLEDKDPRFKRMLSQLADTVQQILKRLIEEFSVCAFIPTAFELSIRPDGAVQPYKLPLANGGTLRIIGSVDRVDTMEKDGKTYLRVIDYKSGTKNFNLSEVLSGLNMQMLIYLYAILENGEPVFGDNLVPAGVLYFPARDAAGVLPRTATAEEVANAKLKKTRMDGVVLDEAEAILGMDSSASGRFIPIKRDKGVYTGNLLGLHEFDTLWKKVDENLLYMADLLHAGDIPVRPQMDGTGGACKYCDFAAVCGYEAGDPVREIPDFGKFDDVRKLLQQEKEEEA